MEEELLALIASLNDRMLPIQDHITVMEDWVQTLESDIQMLKEEHGL